MARTLIRGRRDCRKHGWHMEALAPKYKTPETEESGKGLPEQRGVECMKNNYDAKLWDLLEKRKLGNLSQFHQQGFFDEFPLCTRKSDVEFLPDDGKVNQSC